MHTHCMPGVRRRRFAGTCLVMLHGGREAGFTSARRPKILRGISVSFVTSLVPDLMEQPSFCPGPRLVVSLYFKNSVSCRRAPERAF